MLVGTVCGHTKLGVECRFVFFLLLAGRERCQMCFSGCTAGRPGRRSSGPGYKLGVLPSGCYSTGSVLYGRRGTGCEGGVAGCVGVCLRARGGVGHGRGELHQHHCLGLLRGVRGAWCAKGGVWLGAGQFTFLVA